MFNSIREVYTEFFKLFEGKVSITDSKTGSVKPVLVRYSKKSSGDYTEETPQQIYPCVSIQDYTPTIHDRNTIYHNTYVGGRTEDGEQGYTYTRPIQFEFRFDVSVAAKKYLDWTAIRDYFFTHYVGEKRLLLNSRLSGEFEVGEICPILDIRITDIPRTDGVFETNFEFTLAVWIATKDAEIATLVKEVQVHADTKSV